jgi:transposase
MTAKELQAAEARYQRAQAALNLARDAREQAIRAACQNMSTREVAKHVSVTAQRVHQIAQS